MLLSGHYDAYLPTCLYEKVNNNKLRMQFVQCQIAVEYNNNHFCCTDYTMAGK